MRYTDEKSKGEGRSMFPVNGLKQRIGDLLGELDALSETVESETLEDLNAELEDALLLLGDIRLDTEDAREELEGALEAFMALSEDYRALSGPIEALGPLAQRLESLAAMGLNNLD